MTKENFRNYIREAKFRELFNSLGWNNYKGYADFDQVIDDVRYDFKVIATIKGYQVIVCKTDTNITASFCKRLDYKIRSQAQNYILIFQLPGDCHHVWAVPVKKTEKRDMVLVEYHTLDQTDLLFSKLDQLTFPLGKELNIVDVIAQVQGCFEVNSEKITKDFYTGFQKQHTAFCKFISGIDDEIADKDNKNKQWYTSVMLNRLMFCYFIQKKGFLDGDKNYLGNKLAWSKMMQGNDQFFTFYKSFLLQLFYDGINTPMHTEEFKNEFGRIPYLNGGMFDRHQLELDYADIDIKDEAFEQLFAFFDKWEWHLDTRVTASGKDINPDVLGYIFEQYINDRAQMGAYYTKEDITEYIGKNCILPFLMDRLKETDAEAFSPDGYVWSMLKGSGSRYIYDAVKKGADYYDEIPEEIAVGIDATQPNLLERRAHWNEKTPDRWALPTEIWRESIERMQRCKDIQSKITSGEIHEINDFITYNLDIRQFVQDLLEKTEDHKIILHFNRALSKVTILDPTCGSGAFLFAAMNILEPLYEICVNRMREFNAENPSLFKKELDELDSKYRSNVQYFIYKTIILHNLYGVDIMHEAVEIAKLRLFLKMVAVVEVDMRAPNLGLDPLPDIDFNIRCGNTLVGYATEEQLNNDLQYGDMFANLEFREKIETEMDKVAHAFDAFRMLQLSQNASDMQAFKIAKKELADRLVGLNELLNRKLFASNGAGKKYNKWLADTQPFHWLAEYYQIIHGNGGFDVIIGNPPYVSMSDIDYLENTQAFSCSDLYGHVIKRVFDIIHPQARHGFVVMHNLAFSRNFKDVRRILLNGHRSSWFSYYSRIPSGLFSGDCRVRNTIYILSNANVNEVSKLYTTRMHRWFSEQRNELFKTTKYLNVVPAFGQIPMADNSDMLNLIVGSSGVSVNTFYSKHATNYPLYYKKTGYNWLTVSPQPAPIINEKGKDISKDSASPIFVESSFMQNVLLLLLNGKIAFIKWLYFGDDFHVTTSDLQNISIAINSMSEDEKSMINKLAATFRKELPSTEQYKLNAGLNVATYDTSKLWYITDQSDALFVKYMGTKLSPEFIMAEMDNIIAKSYISCKKD